MKRDRECEVDPFGVPFREPVLNVPALTVPFVRLMPSAKDVEFDKLRGGNGLRGFFDDPPPPGPVWANVLRDLRESNVVASSSSVRKMAARMGIDRDRAGRAKYGKPLEVHDGRTMRDAVEEGADKVAYLRRELDQLLEKGRPLDHRAIECRNLYLRALGLWLDLMQHWADHYPDGAAFRAEAAHQAKVAATFAANVESLGTPDWPLVEHNPWTDRTVTVPQEEP